MRDTWWGEYPTEDANRWRQLVLLARSKPYYYFDIAAFPAEDDKGFSEFRLREEVFYEREVPRQFS